MKHYSKSLSKKILGVFFLVAVLMACLVTVSHSVAMQVLNNQHRTYYSNLVSVISTQVNSKLNSLEKLAIGLTMDQEILTVNQSNDAATSLWRYRDVLQAAELYASNYDIKNTINIYLSAKNRVISSTGRFSEINEFNSPNEYFASGLERLWFCRSKHEAAYCGGCNKTEHMVEVISYYYRDAFNGKNSVCVGVDIKKTELTKYIQDINFIGNGVVFMASARDELIFSDGSGPAGFKDIYEEISARREKPENAETFFSWNNSQVVFSKDNGPMLVGVVFDEAQGVSPIRAVLISLILCIFVVLVLTVSFVLFSNRKMFKPFGKLVQAMERVKEGDLSVRIYNEPEDEMGFVYRQFNQMTERIDHLVNQVYLQDLRSTKTELEILQAQINPHFLFNCLNFIYQMSMAGKQKPVSDMSIYLSKYFRFSIHMGEDLIPLGEELENIGTYMKICIMQYPNQVEYSDLVPEQLRDLPIPRLSVQTLAENAFQHGLKNNTEKGCIFLEAAEDEVNTYICVCNDHSDLTPAQIEALNRTIHDENEEKVGYGLNNTHRRFQLYFGPAAGISLKLRDYLTVAQVTIPKKHSACGEAGPKCLQ